MNYLPNLTTVKSICLQLINKRGSWDHLFIINVNFVETAMFLGHGRNGKMKLEEEELSIHLSESLK